MTSSSVDPTPVLADESQVGVDAFDGPCAEAVDDLDQPVRHGLLDADPQGTSSWKLVGRPTVVGLLDGSAAQDPHRTSGRVALDQRGQCQQGGE